jgi:NAD+ diphosphatase
MIFTTPSRFTGELVNPNAESSPSYWFLFQGNELLVHPQDNDRVEVLKIADPQEIGITIEDKQPIGSFDGIPCFAAVVPENQNVAPLTFIGLRALFGKLNEEILSIAGRALQIVDWYRSHQFCGRCGSKTALKESERCLECTNCKQLHYPRVAPAIMVMIQRGEEFLLARSPHFIPGMYSALAGFSEPGETLEETLHREVYEEVGIKVKNIRYFASQPWPFPHSLMIAFHADYESGEINIDPNEIEDAQWFHINKLPERLPSEISISRKLINATLEKLGRT